MPAAGRRSSGQVPAEDTSARRTRSRQIAHPSPAERAGRGKALRSETPRSSHAAWQPPENRADPVALLAAQNANRVPELVPIRHGRMLASPFAFFRGGAAVMAADLADTPQTGIQVQLCGDAHLSNFGGFASAERSLVFDINDFDETLPGPWEWDVKRLAASFEIAGRDRGFSESVRRAAVLNSVGAYRTAMRRFASMKNLELWYSRLDLEALLPTIEREVGKAPARNVERNLAKARTKDSMRALAKLTQLVDGEPRFRGDPPLVVPVRDLLAPRELEEFRDHMHELFRTYRASLQDDRRLLLEAYRFVDLARKVVGVGSVGTRSWVMLLIGRDNDDPLLLQVKEANASVLEPFAGASGYRNAGQRVVAGQRLMQASSDILLGWIRVKGFDGQQRDFYVRQLWDWKTSLDLENVMPKGLTAYAQMCGWTLARAHARSGDRIAIASYLGSGDALDRALADFASAYADQNERDYRVFADAVETGRIEAQIGT